MNLLAIAARVAGKPLLLMKDMGYDPQTLVYNATEGLTEAERKSGGKPDFESVGERVNRAMLKAWRDAGLPDKASTIQNRMGDDPRNFVHELEHLIMDPDFDLKTGRSSSHSGVESVMEEVLSWGLADSADADGKFIVADGAPDYLYPGAKTVGEAVGAIASATISDPVRRKIRDSAVHRLRTVFKSVMGSPLEDGADEFAPLFGLREGHSLGGVLAHAFTQHVESKYDDWKDLITEEREEGWRKFNLLLRKEMMKLVPGVHSKSPRQVKEEQEAAASAAG